MNTIILFSLLGVCFGANLDHFHNNQNFQQHSFNQGFQNQQPFFFGKQLDASQDVAAQPQEQFVEAPAPVSNGVNVISDEREGPVGAVFRYRLETDDGVVVEQVGTEGAEGTAAVSGSYQYVAPDGQTIQVSYIADENGFQPESPILPVAPPVPAHAQQQIELAAQQRQAGITFDNNGQNGGTNGQQDLNAARSFNQGFNRRQQDFTILHVSEPRLLPQRTINFVN